MTMRPWKHRKAEREKAAEQKAEAKAKVHDDMARYAYPDYDPYVAPSLRITPDQLTESIKKYMDAVARDTRVSPGQLVVHPYVYEHMKKLGDPFLDGYTLGKADLIEDEAERPEPKPKRKLTRVRPAAQPQQRED